MALSCTLLGCYWPSLLFGYTQSTPAISDPSCQAQGRFLPLLKAHQAIAGILLTPGRDKKPEPSECVQRARSNSHVSALRRRT